MKRQMQNLIKKIHKICPKIDFFPVSPLLVTRKTGNFTGVNGNFDENS